MRSLVLGALIGCSPPPSPEPPTAPRAWGQWVWSAEDAQIAEARRARDPGLLPSVLIAEVDFVDEAPKTALRNSPKAVATPRAVLIRFNEGWHAAWDALTTAEIADAWDGELSRLLAQVEAVSGPPVEVQLDYDCPERVLDRYGAVLGALSTRSLAGRAVWITSLVSHVRNPAYGPALRGRVRGHLLQVFDTGDDATTAAAVAAYAADAGVPYRLAVGAFERQLPDGTTTHHRDWFARIGEACPPPACEGVFVFPAGRDWSPPPESP